MDEYKYTKYKQKYLDLKYRNKNEIRSQTNENSINIGGDERTFKSHFNGSNPY